MTDMVEILREQGRHDIADEIERLRARIIELEAAQKDHAAELLVAYYRGQELVHATQRGTLSKPEEPQVFGVTYDIPPSTPR